MTEFFGNIEKLTVDNDNYRKVLGTTPNMQLVAMSLLPNEEIGMERHVDATQFFRIEQGKALVKFGDQEAKLYANDAIIIPPNTMHNVTNRSSTKPLKLYTIYSPPQHPPKCVERSKTDKCKS